jgi:hypothetical protein
VIPNGSLENLVSEYVAVLVGQETIAALRDLVFAEALMFRLNVVKYALASAGGKTG